jgi:hypothetical protein
MGTSTDAILAFGWELGTDWRKLHVELEAHQSFAQWFTQKIVEREHGVVYPAKSDPDYLDQLDAYYDVAIDIEEDYPVYVEIHCHVDAPSYLIAHRAYSHTARRGDPVALDPEQLAVPVGVIHQMEKLVAKLGLDLGPPAWHLASYWG